MKFQDYIHQGDPSDSEAASQNKLAPKDYALVELSPLSWLKHMVILAAVTMSPFLVMGFMAQGLASFMPFIFLTLLSTVIYFALSYFTIKYTYRTIVSPRGLTRPFDFPKWVFIKPSNTITMRQEMQWSAMGKVEEAGLPFFRVLRIYPENHNDESFADRHRGIVDMPLFLGRNGNDAFIKYAKENASANSPVYQFAEELSRR